MVKKFLIIGSLAAAVCIVGCAPTPTKTQPVTSLTPPPVTIPALSESGDYKIGVGDEVEMKFFYTPELNDRMTVRPDGKISIMFAQDVQAAGDTAEQLAAEIKGKLASHLKQLDLVIIVRSFASQKVYVAGEVAKPGSVMLTGRENLLQVINDAGWITPLADHTQVFLVRRDADGNDAIYPVDLKKILTGQDMSQNVILQAGDIVMVPPSGLTSANRWVDQGLRQMIPINTGVYFGR